MATFFSNIFSPLLGHTYDVVIVGAGLAGLQAAYDLQRAGLSCIILEARDRIGGKTLTSNRQPLAIREKHKVYQDLGATWINDTNQSKIWALAKEFGLTTVLQNTTGSVVVEDFDGKLVTFPYGEVPQYENDEDTHACVAIRDLVENTCLSTMSTSQRKELDLISFETYLHLNTNNNARARATAKVWTHAMLGVDPSEVSALYYLEYCKAGGGLMTMRSDGKGGGQYIRIKEGVSSFAEIMAKRLDRNSIKLSQPVVGIGETSNGVVEVMTKTSQTFRCRRVIVTVPTPIYKTISFSPPLPAAKQMYVNSASYGCYIKYFVAFSKPFWRDNGHCGLAQSFLGPVSVFRDTSYDDTTPAIYCLTCFIGGSFGRKWSVLSTQAKLESVLQQVSSVFNAGKDVAELLVDSMESPWMEEEWSGWGCPCPSPPPGVMEPCWDAFVASAGKVHFAGTEMASIWRGYMDGALRTAENSAAEVIAALKKEKARL